MKKTPLSGTLRELGGRMTEFAGHEMAMQFTGIRDEHMAVRTAVGMFDVSHMGDFLITGSGALEYMRRLLPTDLRLLPDSNAAYSHILDRNGIILDDTIVMKYHNKKFLMVPNSATRSRIWNWVIEQKDAMVESGAIGDGDVHIEDLSDHYACIAIQGPGARRTVRRFTKMKLGKIHSFAFSEFLLDDGATIIIAATGYTGEDGFEIYCTGDYAPRLWEGLMKAGEKFGIKPCGLGSRDTLRLEKGFLLSGTDFNNDRTSMETGSAWIIDWRHDFLGKERLVQQKERGDYHRFCGLALDEKGIPRSHCEIYAGDGKIGEVTSGTMSPVLGKGIALAYLPPALVEPGTGLDIDIRGKRKRATVVKLPFV